MEPGRIGVIFDCDGTLLDSMDVWREVEDELARRAGAQLTDADKDELTTLNIPEAGAFFHDRFGLGAAADDVVRMMDELMLDYYRNRAHERPGALRLRARSRGARRAGERGLVQPAEVPAGGP